MRAVQTISVDDTQLKFGPGSTVLPVSAVYQQHVKLYPARTAAEVDYTKAVLVTLPPIAPNKVAFFYLTAPSIIDAPGAYIFFSQAEITTRTGTPLMKEDYLLNSEQSVLVYPTGQLYFMLDDDSALRPNPVTLSIVVGAYP
jgi:hypothetical protein